MYIQFGDFKSRISILSLLKLLTNKSYAFYYLNAGKPTKFRIYIYQNPNVTPFENCYILYRLVIDVDENELKIIQETFPRAQLQGYNNWTW